LVAAVFLRARKAGSIADPAIKCYIQPMNAMRTAGMPDSRRLARDGFC